jgi:hypothetical protein
LGETVVLSAFGVVVGVSIALLVSGLGERSLGLSWTVDM